MRLLLLILSLLVTTSSFAQSSCNHSLTLTDVSTNTTPRVKADVTSTAVTGTNRISYQIYWGDNSNPHIYYMGHNNSGTFYHTYAAYQPYTVKLIVRVIDTSSSPGTLVCIDSTTQTITPFHCNSKISINQVYDTLNNGKVSFSINNPYPNATYSWSFGDGGTGSGTNVSHTYAQHNSYNVVVTRTLGQCTQTDSFIALPVNGCNNLAGLWSYSVQIWQGQLHVNFMAGPGVWGYKSSTVGKKISWDYGDGTPVTTPSWGGVSIGHIYSQAGQYTVKMIVELYDSTGTGNTICKDSLTKIITVAPPPPPPSNLFGDVVLDSVNTVPGDTFKVWLIKYDTATNILSAIDSQVVVKSQWISKAHFWFGLRPVDSYRVKAAPIGGPTTGTGYVPTYGTNALLWSNANVIMHNGTSQVNIVMQKGTVTNGPGFVGGNVFQGANKGTANGIAGINVLLLDAQDKPVLYTMTDANGDYAFNNLPTGTYKIHPELLGFNTTPATILLTANSYTVNGMNFERSLSNKTIKPKTSGISEINSQGLTFKVYPNPATDVVSINWNTNNNETANITITDISGKTVYSAKQKMSTDTQINVAHLQAGLYFLTVEAEYGNNTQKLIIK